MPPWTSLPYLRVPEGFTRLRRLPQGEVADFFLIEAVGVHACAVFNRGQWFFRKLAVLGKLRDAEVIRTVVCAVRESLLHKMRDEVCHLIDLVGGADDLFRMFAVQRVHIFQECLLELFRVLTNPYTLLGGALDDAIIDIRDVHHVTKFESALFQEAPQDVDGNKGAEISNVP